MEIARARGTILAMDAARYYSIRRLSPYQGTVQVADVPGFRALSDDGTTWRVQSRERRSRVSSFGIWRADGGGSLIETERTKTLLDALRAMPPLPFPLADRTELWLLRAKDAKPLALLNSSVEPRAPRVGSTRWRATYAGDKNFVAPSLLGPRGDGRAEVTHMAHCEVLNRCVQKAAGARPRAQWFERGAGGAGRGLAGVSIDDSYIGRELAASDFPELLLREDWEDERDRALVEDYHAWHAANLLTHDNLTRATRARLEAAACKSTTRLYKVRHLLPEIIDTERIKVALVEAVIRRGSVP